MAVKWDFSEPAFRAAAMRGLVRGGNVVRNTMIDLITHSQKSGRVYRRRGVEHQASAPGEPPANDLGDLVRSIEPPRPNASALAVTVRVTAAHARPLEYGTTKMAARPFARPATIASEDEVRAVVLQELQSVRFGNGEQK